MRDFTMSVGPFSLNRTKLGLKQYAAEAGQPLRVCLNRTKLGLKPLSRFPERVGRGGLNRTKLGLKQIAL